MKSLYPEATVEPHITLPDTVRQNWESAEAIVTLVRGRMQASGPITAEHLGEMLALEPNQVFAALEAVEAEGTVLRGNFTPPSDDDAFTAGQGQQWSTQTARHPRHQTTRHPDTRIRSNGANAGYCDAFIGRTLDGLRRQIQPAAPVVFIRFLVRWHHLTPGTNGTAAPVCGRCLAVAGYESAAGLWERRLSPARCDEYDSRGSTNFRCRANWPGADLNPPKKDADDAPSGAGMTRAAPRSRCLRESLGWLLPADRAVGRVVLPSATQNTFWKRCGARALFQHELLSLTALLPAQLDEALHELAALGLATADAFTAVRMISGTATDRRLRKTPPSAANSAGDSPSSPSGRWSLFPGIVQAGRRRTGRHQLGQAITRDVGALRFAICWPASPQRRRGGGSYKRFVGWKPAAKFAAAGSSAAFPASNTPRRRRWNCCGSCATKRTTIARSCWLRAIR